MKVPLTKSTAVSMTNSQRTATATVPRRRSNQMPSTARHALERFPIKPGSPTLPMPGYDVCVLRADGSRCEAGEEGAICIRLPLPPGTLPTLWGDDARFEASYLCEHPGYYLTGDGGYLDEDGSLYVMGRIDYVINVAGHRLSTGPIEAGLAAHPAGA